MVEHEQKYYIVRKTFVAFKDVEGSILKWFAQTLMFFILPLPAAACASILLELDNTWSATSMLRRGEILMALPEEQQPNDPSQVLLTGVERNKLRLRVECSNPDLKRVTHEEAGLLLGISSAFERHRIVFRRRNKLEAGKMIEVDTKVFVEMDELQTHVPGIVKYKGLIPNTSGTLFGVELEYQQCRNGKHIDLFRSHPIFPCADGCGVFVSVDKLTLQDDSSLENTNVVSEVGTEYSTANEGRSASSDRNSNLSKRSLSSKAPLLEVGSAIEVYRLDGESTEYGVIRWIGNLPNCNGLYAGIELDEEHPLSSDGIFRGRRYFTCPPSRGVFVPLHYCRRDSRLRSDLTETTAISGEDFEEEHLVVSDLEENYSTQNIWQYHELIQKQRHLSNLERSNHEQLITIQQLHEEIAAMRDENAEERNRSQNLRQELEQNQLRLENQLDAMRIQIGQLEDRLQISENEKRQFQQALQEIQSRDTNPDWAIESNEIHLLKRELGRGGYGVVQEGEFRGSRVAVKQLHNLILSNHNRRLFEREITVASRCRHPNLLQFIGATVNLGNPLIVMELMETSLRKLLEERANSKTTLSKDKYLTIAADTAKALNYLHLFKPSGIIHRDISSANVLLWKGNTYWRAKVSDYGTANIMRQSMTVNPGAVIYSAPEAGTKTQTPKMDVYSFGVLLCEMCLCELPDPRQRRSQIASVTDNGIRNLIRNCTEENPEERPSMQQVVAELTTDL